MLEERRHEPLALGEVLERTEIDRRIALLHVRGHDHEADRRDRDEPTDHRAEPERRRLEELATGEALAGRRLRHFPAAPSSGMPYSAQRRSTSAFTPGVISISGGHSRVPSGGPLCVASIPILPP